MEVVCLSWETAHLHGEAWVSYHRLRHRLFIERLRWNVPTQNGLEYDQFDTPAAKYILWLDEDGRTRGGVRLIPTTGPYMVRRLWPELISGKLSEGPQIWEATRFGCDHDLEPALRRRVIAELICACQEYGVAHGIQAYLGVMPLMVFRRVIVKAGCPVELLGPTRRFGHHPVSAAYIHVSKEVLAKVQRISGVAWPILQAPVPLAA